MKVSNFKGKQGEFSWKLRVYNEGELNEGERNRVVGTIEEEDELDKEKGDASSAGELGEDDTDNQSGSERKERKIADFLVYGEIGDNPFEEASVGPKNFAAAVAAAGPVHVFNVHIHSMGGLVLDALAMYNTLEAMDADVNTYVDGMAASSASIIAMAGDKVTMRKNTFLMIHNPFSMAIGDSESMRKEADVLDQIRDEIASVYKDKSGLPMDRLRKMMDDETWMNARQAKRLGFADAISGRSKVKIDKPKNQISMAGVVYNLAKFKNVPVIGESVDEGEVFMPQDMPEKKPEPPETPAPLTLEELRAKHPEIYNQIVKDAAAEGQKAGVETERVRRAELEELRTPATAGIVDKAIADGQKASEIMKACFDAQKAFKPAAAAPNVTEQTTARKADAETVGHIGQDTPASDTEIATGRTALVESITRHGTAFFNQKHPNRR